MAKAKSVKSAWSQGTLTQKRRASSRITLVNGPAPRAATLFETIRRVARKTTKRGARRHIYVITCYFDREALRMFASNIRRTIKKTGGTIVGITVAMDVGEWLRCRISEKDFARELAEETNVPMGSVKVLPVQLPGRLMHAKAYAAIRPGEHKMKRGFVVVTSGNATNPGLGFRKTSNLELATVLTDSGSLSTFEGIMSKLAEYEVSPIDALKKDEHLRALALFCRGNFYHKWQGSLSNAIRFKLTLTEKGKAERLRNKVAFKNYEPDSDSISREPLQIQDIFNDIPKPFPDAFWRTYGIDTLLGYWLPKPVAKQADAVLAQQVEPYLDEIYRLTSPSHVRRQSRLLRLEVKEWSSNGWIKEGSAVIKRWSKRVEKFREERNLLKSLLHPFEKLPEEILVGESRITVCRTFDLLRDQLMPKQAPKGTKAVLKEFIANSMTLAKLDAELDRLAKAAQKYLRKHASEAT